MGSGEAMHYEVGSCSMEITPPLSVPYLAGNPRHQFFTGVHDPLFASAVVVSDSSNQAALVTIDGIGINNGILGKDRHFTSELKQRIEKITGIGKEAVILLSGHIHSTPDTLDFRPLCQNPSALPWLDTLMEKICSAVSTASRNKFKACLKIGKGRADGISTNRRGEECLDNEVIVLLFESVDKDKNIIMVNYSCHPVIVQVQELVSADYIGAMRETVKKGLENVNDVLFIQGACGDINPKRGCTRDFRDVCLTGAEIAGEVIKIYSAITSPGYPREPLNVGYAADIIDLPSRQLPGEEEIRKLNVDMEEFQSGEAYWRIREGYEPFKAEIQLIRLGNAVFVGIPGEPMCKMGMSIKESFKPLVSIPAGYANGYLGYIASYEDWERGGYEVELGPWSKVGPESYDMILEKVGSLKKLLV